MSRSPQLPSARRCCGCAACHDVCPKSAIRMEPDGEGFLHPRVDPGRCVGCGFCERTCPVLHDMPERTPMSVRAMQATDGSIRLASSSGGVFSLLAERTLAAGGIVFGAAFDPSDGAIRHVCATTSDALPPLRGSKYVQSDLSGILAKIRDATRSGTFVLFSGTPCQVVAVLCFPGVDRNRLLAVEVICMGVASPSVWRRYLALRTEGRSEPVSAASFRDKAFGWKRYSLSLSDRNGVFYRKPLSADPYLRGMLGRLFLRPSCSRCRFRRLKSGADVTLGDYWNVHRHFPELDDDKGTSLVLANTDAGQAAVDALLPLCRAAESDWVRARDVNPALVRSRSNSVGRRLFFRFVRHGDFEDTVERILRLSRLGGTLCRALRWANRRVRSLVGGFG